MRRLLPSILLLFVAQTVGAQAALLEPATVAEGALTARQAEILHLVRTERGVTDVQLALANPERLQQDGDLTIPRPEGGQIVLTASGREHRRGGLLSWSGETQTNGEVLPFATTGLFVERDGWLTGAVRDGAVVYTVRPLTGGLHAIARVDTRVLHHDTPDWAEFEAQERERAGNTWPLEAVAPPPPDATAAGGGAIVDMLVTYTADVATAYPDPYAFAQLSVDSANQTYATTGMSVRMQLASAFQTATPIGGGMNEDLAALRAVGDGRFDDVHVQRDLYGADLVMLLGDRYTDYCGLAYVNADATYAFGVTAAGCSVAALAFAHEAGHNFGATHDPYVVTTPAYAYGQGSVDLPGRWRTVMAYSNQCDDAGFSCPTVGYWSSPLVTYPDVTPPINAGPTGDAATRDNARLLDERAPTLAAFRATPPPAQITATPASVSLTLAEGGTATATVTIGNAAAAGSRPLDWRAHLIGAATECTGTTILDLDQSQYYVVAAAGGHEFGQSFTPPCTGRLRSIAPTVYGPGGPNVPWTATLRLYNGTGTAGTVLSQIPVADTTPPSGTVYQVMTLPEPVAVTQGAPYTWFLDLETGSIPYIYNASNPYPGGTRFRSNNGLPAGATATPADDIQERFILGPPDRWATTSTSIGNVLPGGSANVVLDVDTDGLAPGQYALTLVLRSNDPAQPSVNVPVTLTVGTVSTEGGPDAALALAMPRPNPASASTLIGYRLQQAGTARLSVVDLLGREVAVLHEGLTAAGEHTATLDATSLAPGVYVVRLDTGGQITTR